MPDFDPFISPRELPPKAGISLTTIWREQRAGRFPPFEQLSPRRRGLQLSKFNQWLAGRRDWKNERESADRVTEAA